NGDRHGPAGSGVRSGRATAAPGQRDQGGHQQEGNGGAVAGRRNEANLAPMSGPLNEIQAASAAQFDRQSDRYGKSHLLADTRDVALGLEGVRPPSDGLALDIATGGGHTALHLARDGWNVVAGDISTRMLENARQ